MNALTTRTIKQNGTSTILQRVAERDKTAIADCIAAYGNLIWALARKFTRSREEAAEATEEIFIDIWQYRESEGDNHSVEAALIARIALRRLTEPFQPAEPRSMANLDAAIEHGAGMDGVSKYL